MADNKKNWFVRHKILTGILVLIVLGVIVSVAGGGTDTSTNQANNSGSAETASKGSDAKTAKVGEAVRDGKFEFVVQGVECGKKEWLAQRLMLCAKQHKANTA